MIHVVFALSDSNGGYRKYTEVAIVSLLENTTKAVTIHLMHDDTLQNSEREEFIHLVQSYHQAIKFYHIHKDWFGSHCEIGATLTAATLFRLSIPDILPRDIKRVIYLDSDILVCLDIAELWNMDMEGYALAARQYAEPSYWMCACGMVDVHEYFNAGILMLDLERIREDYCLLQESLAFFDQYPNATFADNDAMNYVFHRHVLFLDAKYNTFTLLLRGKNSPIEKRIYHYAGDAVNAEEMESFDELYFSYFSKTPFAKQNALSQYFRSIGNRYFFQIQCYQKIIHKVTAKKAKIILFGVHSILEENILKVVSLTPGKDYYVDNNESFYGTQHNGLSIYAPEKIKDEIHGSYIVVVLSRKYYHQIKEQLDSYGLQEMEDFFDGRLLLLQNQGGYAKY